MKHQWLGRGNNSMLTSSLKRAPMIKFILTLLSLFSLPTLLAFAKSEPSANLQLTIDQQLASGNKQITIPAGQYRVTPVKRSHLRLENLQNVTIDATGVELICTENTRAVTITNCQNLTLIGLTIDYDPLPYSQGKITAISDDKLSHEITLFDGYPHAGKMQGLKYEIFRPDTRTLRYGSYHGCTVEQLGNKRIRVTKPNRWKGRAVEQVGDLITIDCIHAPNGAIPHALSIETSQSCTLRHVTVYASPVFGFIENDCSSTLYRDCVVTRRPLTSDLKTRASARLRSLNADAFHSYNATVGPTYMRCKAFFQGDDCVAINGVYHMVMDSTGDTLRVVARRKMNIQAGDPLEILHYDGSRLPKIKALSIKASKPITAEEKAFLQKQPISARFKESMKHAYTLTLAQPLDIPKGSLVASANRLGNGFQIIDGHFGHTRSRGLLIQARDGLIRGNTIEHCQSAGIKAEPEYWWLAAGCPDNLTITNNHISHCKTEAIRIAAKGGSKKHSPVGTINKITLTNNRIDNTPFPQIFLSSTSQASITNNRISTPPKEKKPYTLKDIIKQVHCSSITLTANQLVAP